MLDDFTEPPSSWVIIFLHQNLFQMFLALPGISSIFSRATNHFCQQCIYEFYDQRLRVFCSFKILLYIDHIPHGFGIDALKLPIWTDGGITLIHLSISVPPHPRAGWLPFCCPSCVWSWSSTPAGAGVNAVASLSPRRAPVRRLLMRSTTSPQCWWEDRPVRAWGTRAVKALIPAAPWVYGRHPFWTGT